jgi:hypothetical protein
VERVSFASCSGRLHRIVFESRWLYLVFRALMGHLVHRNKTCDVDIRRTIFAYIRTRRYVERVALSLAVRTAGLAPPALCVLPSPAPKTADLIRSFFIQ